MISDIPSAESVDRYFDSEAAVWLRRYGTEPAFQTRLSKIGPVVIRATHDSEAGRVLDFGGGAGVFSAAASTHASMVLTLDRSTEMLRVGQQHPDELSQLASRINGAHRPNRVQRVAGDLETLRHGAKDIFDVILAISVLEYIADVAGVIHRFVELLRPGGKVILQVPNPHSPWRYSRAAVTRAEQIAFVAHLLRRQSLASYMTVRPYGDRVPWRAALSAAGMDIVSIERVAIGSGPPLRWFHPNLLVVATKPKPTL